MDFFFNENSNSFFFLSSFLKLMDQIRYDRYDRYDDDGDDEDNVDGDDVSDDTVDVDDSGVNDI